MKKEHQEAVLSNVNVQGSLYYTSIKRCFDILISLTLLLVLSPIILLIAIAIYVFDGKPIFFSQVRTGLNQKPFVILKFRTMRNKKTFAGSKAQYSWKHEVPDDFIFKTAHNPDVTKIGVFLRKYSLDEIPQLINVLRNDMSLVGPRPEIPEITKCYNEFQAQRLLVKPGLTGYAQINGRSAISHGEKITFDLHYVHNKSLLGDIQIMFKTFLQAIMGKDAC